MRKRNLFVEIAEGFDTLADERAGKQTLPGSRHSDSIVFFVIHGKWKTVNIHRLMTGACKPLWNQVYSRLLGDRNECNERSQPDVLLEGSRRPTQTQQWDAA